jgi:hypothetical protein
MNSTLIQEKYCARCETRKPLTEWGRDSRAKDGLKSWCKACTNSARKQTGQVVRPSEKLCVACKTVKSITEFHSSRFHSDGVQGYCSECAYWKRAQHRYGITKDGYADLMRKQNGSCAICSEYSAERLCIDHDHKSGRVRGLLCQQCNHAIGKMRDNPLLLIAGAEYLRKTQDGL